MWEDRHGSKSLYSSLSHVSAGLQCQVGPWSPPDALTGTQPPLLQPVEQLNPDILIDLLFCLVISALFAFIYPCIVSVWLLLSTLSSLDQNSISFQSSALLVHPPVPVRREEQGKYMHNPQLTCRLVWCGILRQMPCLSNVIGDIKVLHGSVSATP